MKEDVKIKIMNGVRKGLAKAKVKFLREIKEASPVDMGIMRNNIVIDGEKTNGGFTIHSKEDYSSYVEEGHGDNLKNPLSMWPAKKKRGDTGPSTMPFMKPVIYKNRKWLVSVISNSIMEEFI